VRYNLSTSLFCGNAFNEISLLVNAYFIAMIRTLILQIQNDLH